jgi:hypothetical protein
MRKAITHCIRRNASAPSDVGATRIVWLMDGHKRKEKQFQPFEGTTSSYTTKTPSWWARLFFKNLHDQEQVD